MSRESLVTIVNVFDPGCVDMLKFTTEDGSAVRFTTHASDLSTVTLTPIPILDPGRIFTVDLGSVPLCGNGPTKTVFGTKAAPRIVRIESTTLLDARWHGGVELVERVSVLLSEDLVPSATGAITLELPDGHRLKAEAPERSTLLFMPGSESKRVAAGATMVIHVGDEVRFQSDAAYVGERRIEYRATDGTWVPDDLKTGEDEACESAGCASSGVTPFAFVALLVVRAGRRQFSSRGRARR